MHLLIITVVAFLAAAINSVAGGGTFLTFPTLVGVGGLTDKVANMTSTLGLWPGSAASIYAARKDIACVPRRMAGAYSPIRFVGGTAGAVLFRYYTSTPTLPLGI